MSVSALARSRTKPDRSPPKRDGRGRPKRGDIPRNRLRYLRERHKPKGLWLTTAEVATLTGITESNVSRHEQHERGLTEKHVMAYAQVYKVKPHQLFAYLTIDRSRP